MSATDQTTPVVPAVYADIAAVMQGVSHVAKRDRNTHQNFAFRGVDAVVNAVGPKMREHGLLMLPRLVSEEVREVRTAGGKASTEVRVTVDYVFVSSADGSTHTIRTSGTAWDAGDKAGPKAWSIALRIALLQAFALPTDEPDPDSHSYELDGAPQQQTASQPQGGTVRMQRGSGGGDGPITEAQNRMMHAELNRCGVTDRGEAHSVMSHYAGRTIGSASELTSGEASRVIDAAILMRDTGRWPG